MTIIRPRLDASPQPFESLSDHDFAAAFEAPVRDAIAAIHRAVVSGDRRVVVVLPAASALEVSGLAAVAAAAEAVRIAALSAAAAHAGRTSINVVTVPSLDAEPDPQLLQFLSSEAASGVSGQTIGSAP